MTWATLGFKMGQGRSIRWRDGILEQSSIQPTGTRVIRFTSCARTEYALELLRQTDHEEVATQQDLVARGVDSLLAIWEEKWLDPHRVFYLAPPPAVPVPRRTRLDVELIEVLDRMSDVLRISRTELIYAGIQEWLATHLPAEYDLDQASDEAVVSVKLTLLPEDYTNIVRLAQRQRCAVNAWFIRVIERRVERFTAWRQQHPEAFWPPFRHRRLISPDKVLSEPTFEIPALLHSQMINLAQLHGVHVEVAYASAVFDALDR